MSRRVKWPFNAPAERAGVLFTKSQIAHPATPCPCSQIIQPLTLSLQSSSSFFCIYTGLKKGPKSKVPTFCNNPLTDMIFVTSSTSSACVKYF